MRSNSYWMNVAGLSAALMLAASPAFAVPIPDPIYGRNLIVNGNAEAGTESPTGNDVEPIPGWVTHGNFTAVQYGASGYPTAASPGPVDRGANFFSGGPDNASSSATQGLLLPSSISADIATGEVSYTLSGWFGGTAGQDDHASLSLSFSQLGGGD